MSHLFCSDWPDHSTPVPVKLIRLGVFRITVNIQIIGIGIGVRNRIRSGKRKERSVGR